VALHQRPADAVHQAHVAVVLLHRLAQGGATHQHVADHAEMTRHDADAGVEAQVRIAGGGHGTVQHFEVFGGAEPRRRIARFHRRDALGAKQGFGRVAAGAQVVQHQADVLTGHRAGIAGDAVHGLLPWRNFAMGRQALSRRVRRCGPSLVPPVVPGADAARQTP